MPKTILITGATDGIGLESAKMLVAQDHYVLLHGRNPAKLAKVEKTLAKMGGSARLDTYVADLSGMAAVEKLAKAVTKRHAKLDVLINNAGVLKVSDTITQDGLDVRFAVNTIAPYLLTRSLLPLIGSSGRVINLSSAAQSTVDPAALAGRAKLTDDFTAYAQSKLALTMWSRSMAHSLGDKGPLIVAINPGSLLASKMVKEGFGVAGSDLRIGADILVRAALSDEFADASGQYFDNDAGSFTAPHADALNSHEVERVMHAIKEVLVKIA